MPIQTRAVETRKKVLQAAVEEFSAHGFHGARVDAIARRAGVNKQRIYAYYGDKDNLFAAVLRHSHGLIAAQEQALLSLTEADLPRLGELLLRGYMTFHETTPHFWRLLAWENLEGGAHVDALPAARVAAFAHLRALYARGQACGLFPTATSFETFILVLSSLSFFYHANRNTMSRTLGVPLDHPTFRERMVRESLALLNLNPAKEG